MNRILLLLLVGGMVMLTPVRSQAVDAVWTGAWSDDWMDPENWWDPINSVNVDISSGLYTLVFGPSDEVIPWNSFNDYLVGGITFRDSTAPAYEIMGMGFRLAHGGIITMESGVTQNMAVRTEVILEASSPTGNGSHTFSNHSAVAATGPRLIFDNTIRGGETTGAITLTLAGSIGSRNNAASTANEISGNIEDGDALGGLSVVVNTSGPTNGAWYLTGYNSYTGNTTVTAGTLFINSIGNIGEASAIGAGQTLSLASNTFLMYTGGAATTNKHFIINGGSWFNNGSGAITITEDAVFSVTGSVVFRGNNHFIINTEITGNGNVNRTDGGTVYLNNSNNSFTGNISISTGTFEAVSIADAGVASAIGKGSTITLGQNQANVPIGRLRVNSPTGGSTNRNITLANGTASNTMDGSGGILESAVDNQTVTFSGTVKANHATAHSYLELTGVGNGVLSNVVGGTTGNASEVINMQLVKTGNGVWELQRGNLYHRGTEVRGGTLLVNNTTGSGTGRGNVNVNGGILGGNGIISSDTGATLTVASNGKLMVGNTHQTAVGVATPDGYVGALSSFQLGNGSNLSLNFQGELLFDLFAYGDAANTYGDADLLVIDTLGSITIGSNATIVLADLSGGSGWTEGTWKLIDWGDYDTSTISGSFKFNLANNSMAEGYGWDTSRFLIDGTISIQAQPPFIWTGDGDTNSWGTAANWDLNQVPNDTSAVIFAGAEPTSIVLGADRHMRSLTFTGEASYTILDTGDGVIYLAGYSGTDTARLEILGGTQTFNKDIRLGTNSSIIYFTNDGVANINSTLMANDWRTGQETNKTLIIDGTGTTNVRHLTRRHATYDMDVIVNGGTLTINQAYGDDAGSSTGAITGTWTINGGKVRINNERSLGGELDRIASQGGTLLPFNAAHLTLNGGTLAAFGSFAIDDAHRGITLGADGGTFEAEGSNTLTVSNVIIGLGPLTIRGPGNVVLAAANTYTGDTIVVNGGKLLAGNTSGSATGFGNVMVEQGGLLGGAGTIYGKNEGAITLGSGSTLRVGNTHGSAGTFQELNLGIGGDVDILFAGTLQFDLFSSSDGILLGESDLLRINTTGMVTLGGAISVADVSGQSAGGWSTGMWQLIDWGDSTPDGYFTFTLPNTVLADGYMWDVTNFYTNGTISIVENRPWIWTGAVSDSWGDAGNWSEGSVPDRNYDVEFGQAGAGHVTNAIVGNRDVRDIYFNGISDYTITSPGDRGGGVIYSYGKLLQVDGGTQTLNAQLRPVTGGIDYTILSNATLQFTSPIMFHRLAGSGNIRYIMEGTGDINMTYFSRRDLNYDASVVKRGSGTLTLNGGTDNNTSSAAGAYITGSFTIEAGKVRINDERNLGGNPAAYNAEQLMIDGGTLSAYANVTIDDTNRGVTFGSNGATLEVENAAHTMKIANEITGEGDLTVKGPGTVELSAANTYTGNTTVNLGGKLMATNTSGSATGSGHVTVSQGGLLGGTGSISGGDGGFILLEAGSQLMVGTTHAAGGAAQTLQLGMGDNVDVEILGDLYFDLFAGSGSNDLLQVSTTGLLNLNNNVVYLAADSTDGWVDGQTWKLIDWSGVTPSEVNYDGMTLATTSIDGFNLTQFFQSDGYYVTAVLVPEPAKGLLFLLGLSSMVLRRKRPRHS